MKNIKHLIALLIFGFIFMNSQTMKAQDINLSSSQVIELEIPSGLKSTQINSKSNSAKQTTITKKASKNKGPLSITFDSDNNIVKIITSRTIKSNILVSGSNKTIGVPCPHCIDTENGGYDKRCVVLCVWEAIFGSEEE